MRRPEAACATRARMMNRYSLHHRARRTVDSRRMAIDFPIDLDIIIHIYDRHVMT